jgi:hypothetical protein
MINFREIMTAIELLVEQKPNGDGVTSVEIGAFLGCKNGREITSALAFFTRSGRTIKTGNKRPFFYKPVPGYKPLKEWPPARRASQDSRTLPANPSPASKLSQDSKTLTAPASKLREHLEELIGALEKLQEHIPLTLALLLDLDRDFTRYEKIREVLQGVKKLAEITP